MSPEHYEGYYESYRHRKPKKISMKMTQMEAQKIQIIKFGKLMKQGFIGKLILMKRLLPTQLLTLQSQLGMNHRFRQNQKQLLEFQLVESARPHTPTS